MIQKLIKDRVKINQNNVNYISIYDNLDEMN